MIESMAWGHRRLEFNLKIYIMGVLNCTHDSFYPGSRKPTLEAALDAVREMLKSGVDIIDIGGESSRPGSDSISPEEELERVCVVIERIRKESDIMISIDSTKAKVAAEAIGLGGDIVNDISGLRNDPEMKGVIARAGIPVIIMHMRGTPKNMQKAPYYQDTLGEIKAELEQSIGIAQKAGIPGKLIIIDPGIGFGKRVEDNLQIIRDLSLLKTLKHPILIGISRKSFIGAVLKKEVDERLTGTITANTVAVLNGANIVRVHDYSEADDMVRMIHAIKNCRLAG